MMMQWVISYFYWNIYRYYINTYMNLDTCRLILGFMSSSWQSLQFSKTRCPIIRLWDPKGNDHISHLRRKIIFPATFQGDMFHFLKGNYHPWRLTAPPEIEFSGARRAVSLLMTGWPTLGLWMIESIPKNFGCSLTCLLRIASLSIVSNQFLPLYWALAPWHRKTDEVGWPSSCDVLATWFGWQLVAHAFVFAKVVLPTCYCLKVVDKHTKSLDLSDDTASIIQLFVHNRRHIFGGGMTGMILLHDGHCITLGSWRYFKIRTHHELPCHWGP